MFYKEIVALINNSLTEEFQGLDIGEQVESINEIRAALHKLSPFKNEPVDCVKWVANTNVKANDYNPNSVAPPEMELLRLSIENDGYTQPIVSWENEGFEVVDGFHRHRVGKECDVINERVHGYLPLVVINDGQSGLNDRMASTIRHNRARGKHSVESMSDIVIELKKRNWSDNRIAKELGMDQDEVLRLCQITGLTQVFSNDDFSKSWEAVIMSEDEISVLDEEDVRNDVEQAKSDRVFHEWHLWECYPAGFYGDKPPKGMSTDDCQEKYREFLADIPRFDKALKRVISEWKLSCEHYLTNEKMNRIAWLGQASLCIETGIPSRFCGGYNLLTDEQKEAADRKALEYLNIWLEKNGRHALDWESAQSKTSANIY
jgi:ParB-like chromosome segregation protein Spo0J